MRGKDSTEKTLPQPVQSKFLLYLVEGIEYWRKDEMERQGGLRDRHFAALNVVLDTMANAARDGRFVALTTTWKSLAPSQYDDVLTEIQDCLSDGTGGLRKRLGTRREKGFTSPTSAREYVIRVSLGGGAKALRFYADLLTTDGKVLLNSDHAHREDYPDQQLMRAMWLRYPKLKDAVDALVQYGIDNQLFQKTAASLLVALLIAETLHAVAPQRFPSPSRATAKAVVETGKGAVAAGKKVIQRVFGHPSDEPVTDEPRVTLMPLAAHPLSSDELSTMLAGVPAREVLNDGDIVEPILYAAAPPGAGDGTGGLVVTQQRGTTRISISILRPLPEFRDQKVPIDLATALLFGDGSVSSTHSQLASWAGRGNRTIHVTAAHSYEGVGLYTIQLLVFRTAKLPMESVRVFEARIRVGDGRPGTGSTSSPAVTDGVAPLQPTPASSSTPVE